jgi:hypothetical protein
LLTLCCALLCSAFILCSSLLFLLLLFLPSLVYFACLFWLDLLQEVTKDYYFENMKEIEPELKQLKKKKAATLTKVKQTNQWSNNNNKSLAATTAASVSLQLPFPEQQRVPKKKKTGAEAAGGSSSSSYSIPFNQFRSLQGGGAEFDWNNQAPPVYLDEYGNPINKTAPAPSYVLSYNDIEIPKQQIFATFIVHFAPLPAKNDNNAAPPQLPAADGEQQLEHKRSGRLGITLIQSALHGPAIVAAVHDDAEGKNLSLSPSFSFSLFLHPFLLSSHHTKPHRNLFFSIRFALLFF